MPVGYCALRGLSSGSDNDALNGDSGNDILDGGTGNDTLNGGNDSDTFVFRKGDGVDTISQYDVSVGRVDTLQFVDVAADGLNGLRRIGADLLLDYGAGDSVTLQNYFVLLNNNSYRLNAIQFSDTTLSFAQLLSKYAIKLGVGNDTMGFDDTAETVYAGAGNDSINGNGGNDALYGEAGSDTLNGGNGSDILDGGIGADNMNGGLGDDTYVVDDSLDVVTEALNQGTDIVHTTVSYTLTANVENLLLLGETAINGIGNGLNNLLTGNIGDNTLNGGAGNDILNGKAGNDQLIGGTGADTFVFDTLPDAVGNHDIIADFNAVDDTIRLDHAVFTSFTQAGGILASQLVTGAGAIALDDDFLLYDTADGKLYYDADANGVDNPVEIVTLTGVPALTAADLVIV